MWTALYSMNRLALLIQRRIIDSPVVIYCFKYRVVPCVARMGMTIHIASCFHSCSIPECDIRFGAQGSLAALFEFVMFAGAVVADRGRGRGHLLYRSGTRSDVTRTRRRPAAPLSAVVIELRSTSLLCSSCFCSCRHCRGDFLPRRARLAPSSCTYSFTDWLRGL